VIDNSDDCLSIFKYLTESLYSRLDSSRPILPKGDNRRKPKMVAESSSF
jgi:hypothetical protein